MSCDGTVIGAQQTYDYFRQIQDRITGFVCSHCSVSKQRMEEMMIKQGMLSRDLGTILVGEQAVYEGIISSVGGIREAVQKLHELADYLLDKETITGEEFMKILEEKKEDGEAEA